MRPYEALRLNTPSYRNKPSPRPFPDILPSIVYQFQGNLRKTDDRCAFCFQDRRFCLGEAFPKSEVVLRPTAKDGVFDVFFCQQKVAKIYLTEDNCYRINVLPMFVYLLAM